MNTYMIPREATNENRFLFFKYRKPSVTNRNYN